MPFCLEYEGLIFNRLWKRNFFITQKMEALIKTGRRLFWVEKRWSEPKRLFTDKSKYVSTIF